MILTFWARRSRADTKKCSFYVAQQRENNKWQRVFAEYLDETLNFDGNWLKPTMPFLKHFIILFTSLATVSHSSWQLCQVYLFMQSLARLESVNS